MTALDDSGRPPTAPYRNPASSTRVRPAKAAPDVRLSDRVALNVLLATYPPDLVDDVLALQGRQQRSRSLPPRMVLYFVMAMCLFAGQGYDNVARSFTEGLAWARPRDRRWETPSAAAFSQARQRLGVAPLRSLFARVCRPMAKASTEGGWYRGWRLVAVDGATFDVPETAANVAAFGRTDEHGAPGYPQMRVLALGECGTNAVFAVSTAGFAADDVELAKHLFGSLAPGMLLLGGPDLAAFDLWLAAAANGCELLWQAQEHQELPVASQLVDGSYLSHLMVAPHDNEPVDPVTVRVIEYTTGGSADTSVRLITTILDPTAAPALSMALAYAQRWKIGPILDELTIRQQGRRPVLRSLSPTGVEQEVYGHLLVHYASCALVQRATPAAGLRSDLPSASRAIRVIPRQAVVRSHVHVDT